MLEAFSPSDGIGFVRRHGELRLVQPPYSLLDSPIVSEESLEDAVLNHGFYSTSQQFTSWPELIAHLESEVVQSRESVGEFPDMFSTEEVIALAPLEALEQFLDIVETTLIPGKQFDQAEAFLLPLLTSESARHNSQLVERGANLLRLTKQAKECSEVRLSHLARNDRRFRSLFKHNQSDQSARLAQVIRERGSVFAISR